MVLVVNLRNRKMRTAMCFTNYRRSNYRNRTVMLRIEPKLKVVTVNSKFFDLGKTVKLFSILYFSEINDYFYLFFSRIILGNK